MGTITSKAKSFKEMVNELMEERDLWSTLNAHIESVNVALKDFAIYNAHEIKFSIPSNFPRAYVYLLTNEFKKKGWKIYYQKVDIDSDWTITVRR